jgi:tetratricopeptide (TPR) repeat protein
MPTKINSELKRGRLIIPLITAIIIILPLISFPQNKADSTAKARNLFDSGEYKKSGDLLKELNKDYPDDLDIHWLYAQSVYWSKRFSKSMMIYEEAIRSHPDNYYLILDYGIKLVDIGELKKAKPLLEKYLTYDSLGTDALIALAKLAYWQGKYKMALTATDKVLSFQPENSRAKGLQDEIILAKAPWIELSTEVMQDDQPLISYTPLLEMGFSKNAFINPLINVALPFYISDGDHYQTPDLRISNKMIFINNKLRLLIEGGVFKLPAGEYIPQAGFHLGKTIFRFFNLEFITEHKPYLSTKANMTNPMKRLNYDFSLNWSGKKGWSGRIGHNIIDFYTEKNKVSSSSFWLLTSPMKIGKTNTHLGYSYSYSNSDENRFIPRETIEDIITAGDYHSQIKGVYNPYFTPRDQHINSAIIVFQYKASQKFEFGLKSTYGFYSTIQNPYFYIDRRGNRLFINKDYYNDKYHPYDGRVYINWNLNKKISLRSEYALVRTYFYESYHGLISLKVII